MDTGALSSLGALALFFLRVRSAFVGPRADRKCILSCCLSLRTAFAHRGGGDSNQCHLCFDVCSPGFELSNIRTPQPHQPEVIADRPTYIPGTWDTRQRNLPLQSYWSLSCDHGLHCSDELMREQQHATTESRGGAVPMELPCSEEAWESAQSAIQSAS